MKTTQQNIKFPDQLIYKEKLGTEEAPFIASVTGVTYTYVYYMFSGARKMTENVKIIADRLMEAKISIEPLLKKADDMMKETREEIMREFCNKLSSK